MGTFRSAHFVFNFPTNLSHEGGLSVITCTLAWPSLDKRLRQADASSSGVTNTKASMPEGNDAAAGPQGRIRLRPHQKRNTTVFFAAFRSAVGRVGKEWFERWRVRGPHATPPKTTHTRNSSR